MSNEKETKLCKHCQSEIPKKAKVCPNCRKKQGGILRWVIILVVILALIGSCAGDGDDEKASDTNPQKVGETTEKNNSVGQQPENLTEEVDNEFSLGEIVETSYLRISYMSAEEYISDNEFIQPKEGHIYYKMEFEFENISESDQYVSSWDFNCYADGYDMEQSYIIDGLDLDATLSPGKKTKGAVVFEVPEDAESIILEYETNFWTENKIVFVVK